MIETLTLLAVYLLGGLVLVRLGRDRGAEVLVVWLCTQPLLTPWLLRLQTTWMEGAMTTLETSVASLANDMLHPDRLVVGCLAVAVGLAALRGSRSLARPSMVEGSMAFFCVVLAANVVLLADNKDHAVMTFGDAIVLPFAIFLLARNLLGGERNSRLLHRGSIALAGWLVVYGLVQRAVAREPVQRLFGPFPNQTVFGTALVVVLLMVLSRREEDLAGWRRAYLLVVLVMPAVLFFTLSRTTWISGAAALITWVAVWWPNGWSLLPRAAAAVVVSGVLVATWAMTASTLPGGRLRGEDVPLAERKAVRERMARARAEGPEPEAEGAAGDEWREDLVEGRLMNSRSVGYRLRTWRVLVAEVADQPLFGVGLNNTPFVLAERLPEQPSRGARAPLHPHSAYLAFLFETGIVGLLALLAVLGSIGRLALGVARGAADPEVARVGACLTAALVGFALPGIPSNAFYRPSFASLLFFAFAGFVAARCGSSRARTG